MSLKYKRVLLKLSGEALQGNAGFGVDFDTISRIGNDILDAVNIGVEIAIVVGGGYLTFSAVTPKASLPIA